MGNKNMCGNFQHEQRAPLNAIGPSYDLSEQHTFKAVSPQFLKYPQKFPYILSQMQENSKKFIDQYFNCILNEEKVVGDQFYAYHNVMHITWKRSDELVNTKNHKITDRITHSNTNKVPSIYKILCWIMDQPKLVKQIFRFEEIAKEGLVLLYLPYYGSQDNPIEIVIDNYLPTHQGTYIVPLPTNTPVGVLLLEKGMAKLLGSYQALRQKTGRQIFEILVGIPIVVQGLEVGNDEVQMLSRFYNPHYKVASIQQQLASKHSQYLKINVVRPTNMSISTWQIDQRQQRQQRKNEIVKHSQIILELIRRDKYPQGSFSRVAYASKLWENKTILKAASPKNESIKSQSPFFRLQEGDYYMHIFSQSDKNTIIANIIVYSEFQVDLQFRKENHDLNEIKRVMICNIFKEQAKLKPLDEFLQCEKVKSKFVWDGYRGILCLNCIVATRIKVRISILPEYRRKIKFEESSQFEMEMELLQPNKIVTFLKLNKDVGRFYKVALANI